MLRYFSALLLTACLTSGATAEEIDLLIVSGQSNAVGYDAKPDHLPTDDVDAKVMFWWRCGDPPPDEHDSTSGSQWTHLQAQPLGNPKKPRQGRQYGNFAQPEGGFGPEIGLARTLAKKEGKRFAVVKAAFSGTGMQRDWNPADPGEGGSCYRALVSETLNAIATAKKDGIVLRPRAFVWVQGESDAKAEHAAFYADNLGAMLNQFRSDIGAPNLTALIAVNTQFGAGKNEFMPIVIEQQKLLASRDMHCEYVDTSEATVANRVHYDAQGTLDVGQWAAESLLQSESNPPGTVRETRRKLLAGEPVKVVCFGDSVTGVYYHTGSRRAYTDMLGIALRKTTANARVEMVNAGISGHTTVNALARIDRDVLAHNPDLVTVMFGLNDMTRVSIEDYESNLKLIITKCRSIGAEVVLATPNNVVTTGSRPTEKLIRYCEVVRRVGREVGAPVCDCYREMDGLRDLDGSAWRLLMSDAIHPNMDGHKVVAQLLARTISGRNVSLDDTFPLPPLVRTTSLMKNDEPVRVLAMAPVDGLVEPALKSIAPDAKVEVTSWPVEGLSLARLEADAKTRVRSAKPDLVVIAVPRSCTADSDEAFAKSFAWVMNWSLNFGPPTWDCVVVHPDVFEGAAQEKGHDDLVRRLVHAQDLSLIDRTDGDDTDATQILSRWFRRSAASSVEKP